MRACFVCVHVCECVRISVCLCMTVCKYRIFPFKRTGAFKRKRMRINFIRYWIFNEIKFELYTSKKCTKIYEICINNNYLPREKKKVEDILACNTPPPSSPIKFKKILRTIHDVNVPK